MPAPFQFSAGSSFHARRNGGDDHRGHLELLCAIDDAVTGSDPGEVRVNRPDCAAAILCHQEANWPIQTCIGIRRDELRAERRIAEHQKSRRIDFDAGVGGKLGLVDLAKKSYPFRSDVLLQTLDRLREWVDAFDAHDAIVRFWQSFR